MHEKIIAPGEKLQKEPVLKVERVQVQLLVDFGAPRERKITNLMDCPPWEVEDISSNKLCIKNGFTNFFLCKVFCQRIQICVV